MKSAFSGFPTQGISFLRDLAVNNDREWFTPRKAVYEEHLRLPMIQLIRAVHGEMLRFAPAYVGEPAKCIFRVYRDTRFSKNKTPYKTHVAASFWRNGMEKNQAAGYYFSVSPKEIEIGGGLYSPDPETLLAVRQRIAESAGEFENTYQSRSLGKLLGELQGATTTRPPRGFDPAHPAIELLKRKQYCFFVTLDPALATGPKLFGEIVKRFEAITPFVEFLNAPFTGQEKRKPLC